MVISYHRVSHRFCTLLAVCSKIAERMVTPAGFPDLAFSGEKYPRGFVGLAPDFLGLKTINRIQIHRTSVDQHPTHPIDSWIFTNRESISVIIFNPYELLVNYPPLNLGSQMCGHSTRRVGDFRRGNPWDFHIAVLVYAFTGMK